MKRDSKWIEVLSGKSKPNKKNRDELEALHLRESIKGYEQSIGLDKITAENSFFRFKELQKAKKNNENKAFQNKKNFSISRYIKNKIYSIKLLIAFGIGLAASLLLPLITINAPMQVANNDINLSSVDNIEKASKEEIKQDLSVISKLKNIDPKFHLIVSHKQISIADYKELKKINSLESNDYLNHYLIVSLNNFNVFQNFLDERHMNKLFCFPKENKFNSTDAIALIDHEIRINQSLNLEENIDQLLLRLLNKKYKCS